jgi:hypothetical protein
MNMTPEDLNAAWESLPVPLEGPILSGISLQEAILVNPMHDIVGYTQGTIADHCMCKF